MSRGFQCATPPLCRNCGKPIAKLTTRIYFGRTFGFDTAYSRSIAGHKPGDVSTAQRLVNEKIVSVRWNRPRSAIPREIDKREPNFISEVTVWDGESYVSDCFCKGECAISFGYRVARATPPGAALKARSEGQT